MTPLLFAAALTLAPASAPPGQSLDSGFVRPLPVGRVIDIGPDTTKACAALATLTVGPDGVPLKKLNELPPGVVEHAVWRSLNGCPVREVVYQGQVYYVGPSIPRLEAGPASRIAKRAYPAAPDNH